MQDSVMVEDGKRWEFDDAVTAAFDDMLKRSIPQYELMRELVKKLGFKYAQPGSYIVDIGCSRGEAMAPFVARYGDTCDYLLLDVSEPMLEVARNRFKDSETARVLHHDLRSGIPKADASLVLSVLTAQFTPIEYRHRILKSIYDNLRDGGAFIFVEKVLGNTSEIDDALVREYYGMKADNRYTQEQIANKRKSLEGVLTPITAKWNEDLLRETGFNQIDCFWRCLNFAGWIAIK